MSLSVGAVGEGENLRDRSVPTGTVYGGTAASSLQPPQTRLPPHGQGWIPQRVLTWKF